MDKHRAALALAASALVLGFSGDLLLRWIPWGINVPVWVVLFVALALVCAAQTERRVALFPAVCALAAAAGMAWRDAPELNALDVLLLLLFLPMLALRARGVRLAAAGLSEVGLAVGI